MSKTPMSNQEILEKATEIQRQRIDSYLQRLGEKFGHELEIWEEGDEYVMPAHHWTDYLQDLIDELANQAFKAGRKSR